MTSTPNISVSFTPGELDALLWAISQAQRPAKGAGREADLMHATFEINDAIAREYHAEPPFENTDDVGAFIRQHMTGSSFMASHDGIRASTVICGARRYYRAETDAGRWEYDLDGTITLTDLAR